MSRSDRRRIISGICLASFTAYLTLAFVSYLFTWRIDQSTLDLPVSKLFFNPGVEAANWSGTLGGMLAQRFMYKWLGLPSFSLIAIFTVVISNLFRIKLIPIDRTIKIAIAYSIWTSIALGYIFHYAAFAPGGTHGYYISEWMNTVIGKPGTAIVLITMLIVMLSLTFNSFIDKSLQFVKNMFSAGKNDIILNATPVEATAGVDDDSGIEPDTEQHIETVDESDYNQPKFQIKTSSDDEAVTDDNEQNKVYNNLNDVVSELVDSDDDNHDPTRELEYYKMPSIDLLKEYDIKNSVTEEELIANKNQIVETMRDFKIEIAQINATVGPTVTLYEIVPAKGTKISKIKNLEDDIALSLAALGIRIIAPIPGRGTIGIEVPNAKPEIVSMRSVLTSRRFQESKFELPLALGKTITNETFVIDLAKAPHILVAGATGQGKSVGLNAMIASLLYKKHPSQLKLVMVDPKRVELSMYSDLEKYYLAKVPDADRAIITDVDKVINTLNSLCTEMDNRYKLLEGICKNIKEYNAKYLAGQLNPNNGHKFLPYIVVIIDEFADLIMTAGKEVEKPICRIAQLARAVGIHMIIATQRPTTNIITGTIKANFPTRVAFRVMQMIDSRTILDAPGANQLIGRGDMLISTGNETTRVQCAFIDTPEIEDLMGYIATQQSYPSAYELPEYVGEGSDSNFASDVDLDKRDSLFEDAARVIVISQQGSTSLIQRKFSIGYNRAGRIVDQLEAAGIVGPSEGSKARQVLIPDEQCLDRLLETLNDK